MEEKKNTSERSFRFKKVLLRIVTTLWNMI